MNVKIPILCFYEPIEKIYSFIPSENTFQSGSFKGGFAVMVIISWLTGCLKVIERACKLIPPPSFERGKPYFRSPLIGQPILANWHRIW